MLSQGPHGAKPTTIALVGDLIGPHRPVTPLQIPAAEAVFEILRHADVTVGNHEGSSFDLEMFSGTRAAVNGGGYPLASPAATRDLPAMGISMVSKANNHAMDWGKRGMLATAKDLAAAGVTYAGIGTSRAAAQRPAYTETVGGSVALISLASTYVPIAQSGEPGGSFGARPGLFAYRVRPITVVSFEDFAVIRRVADSQGVADGGLDGRAHLIAGDILLGEEWFRSGTTPGLIYEADPRDHKDVLTAIRFARQSADVVVVAVHAHETASGSAADRRPPAFLTDLYHDCIDEGADIISTTGPHVVRGMEVYNSRPIFYGLASFFLELESGYGSDPDVLRAAGRVSGDLTPGEQIHARIPVPIEWRDSLIIEVDFLNGTFIGGRAHPLLLTSSTSPIVQGHPRLAEGEDARRILERFRMDSEEFGTCVTVGDKFATF